MIRCRESYSTLPTHNAKFTKIKFAILITSRALLLCRAWRPRSLMCPRRMCQSLVVSSSVAAKASPIIMLHVTLYKFVVRSPLRIVMDVFHEKLIRGKTYKKGGWGAKLQVIEKKLQVDLLWDFWESMPVGIWSAHDHFIPLTMQSIRRSRCLPDKISFSLGFENL